MARYSIALIFLSVGLLSCLKHRDHVEAAPPQTELEQLIEGYDKINDYLVDKDPYGTVESNVEKAIYFLNSKTLKITKFLTRGPMDIALKEFTALKDITNPDHKCTRESYAILIKNDQATEHRTHMPTSKLKPRTTRVDKIVHHYALEHAKSCRGVYPRTFETVYSQMDKEKRDKVENYMNELIGSHLFLMDPDLPAFHPEESYFFNDDQRLFFIENILKTDTMTGVGDIEVAYKAIVDNGPKGMRQLIATRPDKVPGLVRTHLVEPCEYYREKLGPDVFELADYDNAIMEVGERLKPFNMKLSKYYLAWTYFRICKVLIASKADVTKELMGLAKQKVNY